MGGKNKNKKKEQAEVAKQPEAPKEVQSEAASTQASEKPTPEKARKPEEKKQMEGQTAAKEDDKDKNKVKQAEAKKVATGDELNVIAESGPPKGWGQQTMKQQSEDIEMQ